MNWNNGLIFLTVVCIIITTISGSVFLVFGGGIAKVMFFTSLAILTITGFLAASGVGK